MSKLISGREALIALANGEEVEVKSPNDKWYYDWGVINPNSTKLFLNCFLVDSYGFQFRLKPHTITINGIDVPAPFEPKEGEKYYYITFDFEGGYSSWNMLGCHSGGAWRSEDEIKQVVTALRKALKGE